MPTNQPSFSYGAYSDLFAAMQSFLEQYLKSRLDTLTPVKVVGVHEDNSFVDVQPLLQSVKTNGEVITQATTYYNIPTLHFLGQNLEISFMPSVGDMGFLISGKWDMSDFKQTKTASPITSNRIFSYANGVFLPLFFANKEQGINLKAGDTTMQIVHGSVNINTTTANIVAESVNLGGEGGRGIARLGDEVTVGSSKGTITSASEIVKAV